MYKEKLESPQTNPQRKPDYQNEMQLQLAHLIKNEESKEAYFENLKKNVSELQNEYKKFKSTKKSIQQNYQNISYTNTQMSDERFKNTKALKDRRNGHVSIVVDLQPKISSKSMHLYNSQIGQRQWADNEIIYQLKKLDQNEYFIFYPKLVRSENSQTSIESTAEKKDNKVCISV